MFMFMCSCCCRCRDEDWSLTLVSKDYNETLCRSIGCLNDGNALAVVLGDAEDNLQVLQFDPKYEILVCLEIIQSS